MILKKISFFILLTISLNLFGQTTKDEIKIAIVKTKLVDNSSVFGIRQLKVTSDALKKVMIKTKIETAEDNKTKLSAFSLLDTKNKIRYRLADYKGYAGFIGSPELIPYRKSKIYNDKGKEIENYSLPPYDTTVKDYFSDYDQVDYRNFELNINFGTNENPKLSIVYYGETEYNKFTAELFFAILVENTESDYELYYKDQKISDIQFQ